MEEYKRKFAQDPRKIAAWKKAGAVPTLLETLENTRATVLLGLSGQPRSFSEPVIKAMAGNTPRPVIFALSNPTSACEALPEEILALTEGRRARRDRQPVPARGARRQDHPHRPGQQRLHLPGARVRIHPAPTRARSRTAWCSRRPYALVDYTAEKHLDKGLIYPPVEELQEVSTRVAVAVIRPAFEDGVASEQEGRRPGTSRPM